MIIKTKTNKSRPPRNLATTLAIAFFSISALVLLISGALQIVSNIQSQQAALSSQQQVIAGEVGSTVRSFIDDKFTKLETAVEFANPITAASETQQTILESLLGIDPAIREFALLNSQSQQLTQVSLDSHTLPSSPLFASALQGEALTQASKGQRYISPVYIDDVTGDPVIAIAIPLKNTLGDYQGTLITELNLKFMWDLIDQLKVGKTGVAYMVDDQGNLIAYRDTARVLKGENLKDLPEVNEFIQDPSSVDVSPAKYETGIQGTTSLSTHVSLGIPDWAVIVEMPWQEAYQVVIQGSAASVGITFVLAVLAGLVGVFVARRLAVPLVNLTETATRISGGETELQAAVSGTQEVANLASAFNSMTTQLRDLIGTLEQRVADRTKGLATVAEVGTAIATILETDRLLQSVVDLTKERFNLYHSHIYLLDQPGQNLVLASGAGEAGRQMVAEKRSIPLNQEQSLVARAARERKGVTVNDVTQAPDFLPNPLLPDTRSELAVPMIVGGNVIGVFDVQSDQIGRFGDSDINIQTTLAAQVATSIQNVRSFEQSKSQADLESLVNAIGQKIQRTTTVDDTLQTAIREIGLALGASRVSASIAGRQDGGNDSNLN
jgi:putative methionine-R-sulfoxide reductase with GAF domain